MSMVGSMTLWHNSLTKKASKMADFRVVYFKHLQNHRCLVIVHYIEKNLADISSFTSIHAAAYKFYDM